MPQTPREGIDELKTNGLKATLPRLRVLELFQREGVRHLAAEDVYQLLPADDSDIGLATVYRVLVQFVQASLAQGPSAHHRNEQVDGDD